MNILEGNEIIARYVYPEYFKINGDSQPVEVDISLTENSYWIFTCIMLKDFENLCYQKDWNMLVPVLTKILSDEEGQKDSKMWYSYYSIQDIPNGFDLDMLYGKALSYIEERLKDKNDRK
jgi:hypothetical protein